MEVESIDNDPKLMLTIARLDPTYYYESDVFKWCRVSNPGHRGYVCSRPEGHPGFHLAIHTGGTGVCDCEGEPNPWI